MSAKKSFLISTLIILVTGVCLATDSTLLPYANRSSENGKVVHAILAESGSFELPFDPNNYNFMIYDCQGGENSIQSAMQHIGINSFTVCNASNPVTLAGLNSHDILIVGWEAGGGNKSGLVKNIIEQGITGRVILSGHDSDYHTVYGPDAGETFFIQEIAYVLKGSGTGLIVCADPIENFSWIPETWGISSAVSGGQQVTSFTDDGLASGVYDNLTPAMMCNWNTSYHNTFTAWGPEFVSFELGGDGNDVVTIAKMTTPCSITLTKVDDVNDGNCRGPGDYITYTIDYNYPAGPNCPDINDVNIIDYLPNELEFVSASGGGSYDSGSNTVIWNIGTLHPGDIGSVTLKVKVKCPQPGSTITNECQIRGQGYLYGTAYEHTPVCSNYILPMLTKVDDVNGCVGPGKNVNYSICYAANGYGDTNVMITDVLPNEVNYVSSDGNYNPDTRTVTWNIDFPPSASGCVTLVVQVKHNVTRGSTITNYCQMEGGYIDITAHDTNSVCSSWCPIYVDISATGGNNGYSWEDAFTNLQDGLKAAKDFNCNEILVAQGIYKPDVNSANPGGSGARTATFQLVNNIAIYGGFPAGGGTWQQRNPVVYETILSGDLAGNDSVLSMPEDMLTDPCRSENSFHVVTGSGVNSTAILDGFTITGGNADGDGYPEMNNVGGGMYNYGGSPKIKNCSFKCNSARGYPDLTPVGGGGMYNMGGSIRITNCLFKNNWANMGGGGMFTIGASSYVTDVNIINCTFIGNGDSYGAGGIYAATQMYGSSPPTMTNCILWGNEGGQISGVVNVTYCDIQGGWAGAGNIAEDPMLETDGLHLSPCSPCIDAGDNTPPGGLEANDIDGQNRIMNGLVDMGADEFLPDPNVFLRAHCPNPASGSTAEFHIDAPYLSWVAGSGATSHNVYFGTDFNDVNGATTATAVIYRGERTEPNYPLRNLAPDYKLTSGTTYYWRVDEINGGNSWKGDVWSFIMPNPAYLVVDDFSYGSQAALNAVWQTGYKLPYGGPGDQNTNGGSITSAGNVLTLNYNNTYEVYGPWSEAKLDYKYNGSTGVDWTVGGAFVPKAIAVQFDGNMGNTLNSIDVNNDKMYIGIQDAHGRLGLAYLNSDVFAPQRAITLAAGNPAIREWKVALSDLTSPNNVDLNEVNRVYLGIGSPRGAFQNLGNGGMGLLHFANLRVYVQHCNPDAVHLTGDFAGDINTIISRNPHTPRDCTVNLSDMYYLAYDWLFYEPNLSYSPVTNPGTSNLTVWYMFDDGPWSTTIADSSGNGRDATLNNLGPFTWVYAGHNGTGYCVNLEPGYRTWIECPNTVVANIPSQTGQTFAFWMDFNTRFMPAETCPSVFMMHTNVPGGPDSEMIETQIPTAWPPAYAEGPQARFADMRSGGQTVETSFMRFSNFAGRWNHYALVYDTISHTMTMYVNGASIASTTDAAITTVWEPNSVRIGTRSNANPASWGFWQGKLDDFRIYNKALNAAEVQYLATNGTGVRNMQAVFIEPDNLSNTTVTVPGVATPVQIINFNDFAIMAQHWLDQQLWP